MVTLLIYVMNMLIFPADIRQAVDACVTVDSRPLIGISANSAAGASSIHDDYVRSILRAGGIPLLIPLTSDAAALQAIVVRLDGLLLSGGVDVSPLYSGEEPLPTLGQVDVERDRYDLLLTRLAANRQLPILGICRGHQLLNVAFGGKNHQDILVQVPGSLKHRQETPAGHGTHTVRLAPNSVLRALFARDTLVVNSYHHQAIKEPAPDFAVAATASDGVIEAIEAYPLYRMMGVQWHPERAAFLDGGEMLKLFEHFVGEAALFKRAKALHAAALIIDSHCDTPMKFVPGFDIAERREGVKVDLPRLREGLVDAVFMVAYLPQGKRDPESSARATAEAVAILRQIGEQVAMHPDDLAIVRDPADLPRLKREGKKGVFLAIENGYAIGKDLSNLALFKEMGVTYITLCHNGSNDICDSAEGDSEHGGLSPFGRAVVAEMNRLGLVIDVSHAGAETFRDILAHSARPVIASHSSARALRSHPRNLTDDQLRLLASKGGVVQICLYTHFLAKGREASLLDAVAHIDHVVRLVGIDHVGIGSDFDGDGNQQLAGCRAANELPNLTVELLRRGYAPADLEKLWGGNLLRVIEQVHRP
ncbi:MAG: membrane dipeptidase [Odoribacteraceae bacterium]|nr:membrane dipeptidase [Odoribacteraceae bacterium]